MKLIINNLTTCTLSNICLTLDKPGLYGIIGRNGTGKSTLFTAINKEMNYEGDIQISDGWHQGRVSYVATLDIFEPNLRAIDYIKVLTKAELKNAEKYMPLFSASRFFKKPIKKYSLGMKEILAFIYTVSLEADLIIVDELMNGLDNAMRAKAFQILKELSKTKIILLTSHILEEVEKHCDQVYFLSKYGFDDVLNFREAQKLIQETQVFM
ncbi:ATP-binding cassette domain-containing protein [Lactococcus formosensis]|uniref:ATP-binding cassette domain-containing protein n=1 Tax=Lactococcus formosensis TaxID=1281486 RepID=A0A9X4P9N8_9LACT|nr:ATP-binding cassette domain-containing protein [Lactococcus formosensis]MDG6142991.1 ATP-binding cassette domain-containing protein [Lactococcus formosensis]MDG6156284.1 ATP-binding cassette domain-containing protein [Lactococcus formosensis]MDG6160467.1 ATP-binding cassette domain-containing protein [Lactococcus formosensis]MDG6167098.1 ATP-binding cassette domain-containing protein [Lactococcus formosensis]MDG6173366.1 ATP-binding cassette domain-containing protein [Lactococcus formosensi